MQHCLCVIFFMPDNRLCLPVGLLPMLGLCIQICMVYGRRQTTKISESLLAHGDAEQKEIKYCGDMYMKKLVNMCFNT